MSHPSSCHDPSCTLSYRDHLLSINFSASALPTRRVNRTPGQPDEPMTHALVRERRWERDLSAFKRLHDEGYDVPQIDGSALRERQGETRYDLEERKVTIDYTDPR
jgi:hypothetical protein